MQKKLTSIPEIKAVELAKHQREISISEFFAKNRHLLGFDNPRKALLTAIKEAADNSLDACEEARILPELFIEIDQINENRFKIVVEDNGPGIVKEQIPRVFGKLLYGSKFHSLKQSRGQQGIGISAAAMYGQLTTGKPIKVISRISPKRPAHYYELHLDTAKNEPEIIRDEEKEWVKETGTRIEFELEAKYQKGQQSVDQYLKQTAISNPHARILYKNPEGERITFERATNDLPREPKKIKPHPYGIELGFLIKMLRITHSKTLQQFLTEDFSRVSIKVAKEICEKSKLFERTKPSVITREQAEILYKSIQETKIMNPPTDCISPITEEVIIKGLKKEINAEFYTAITRPPVVYRGNPFQIEVGIAYGGDLSKDELVRLMRFANRVPLLYQQSACATFRSVVSTKWNSYGLSQSRGTLPAGPMIIFIHIASVWVPFTSESKEAIAHYPEIIKEIKLALQECGRKLVAHIRKTRRATDQKERLNLFEKYIPEIASSLSNLTDVSKKDLQEGLSKILNKSIKQILSEGDLNLEPKKE